LLLFLSFSSLHFHTTSICPLLLLPPLLGLTSSTSTSFETTLRGELRSGAIFSVFVRLLLPISFPSNVLTFSTTAAEEDGKTLNSVAPIVSPLIKPIVFVVLSSCSLRIVENLFDGCPSSSFSIDSDGVYTHLFEYP
jgi:hypothetical protein